VRMRMPAWGARVVIPRSERSNLSLGPHIMVFAVLDAYPFLTDYLGDYEGMRVSPSSSTRWNRWVRVTSLADLAASLDVTWTELARDLGEEVARVTGRAPAIIDGDRAVADRARLGEMRDIAARLEEGGSLLDLARELREVTEGLDKEEAAALDSALGATVEASRGAADLHLEAVAAGGRLGGLLPEGHPLDNLRREGVCARRLCDSLQHQLERLGGSPSRRRWRESRPAVRRLVDELSNVESRFRRVQQAWFPALAVLGVEGPEALIGDRQAKALESLRRLRLAVARDDAAFVVENGTRLVELLDDLLVTEEEVLAPLAERHLAPGDWAAVRELEDSVAWSLIPSPPPWPVD
jgi:hypothetical protein